MNAQVQVVAPSAAKLLVVVKTKLGKVVPDYAKRAVAENKECKRAAVELSNLLSTIRNTTRKQLLADNEELRVWWESQTHVEEAE